jgi:hypothetical protein
MYHISATTRLQPPPKMSIPPNSRVSRQSKPSPPKSKDLTAATGLVKFSRIRPQTQPTATSQRPSQPQPQHRPTQPHTKQHRQGSALVGARTQLLYCNLDGLLCGWWGAVYRCVVWVVPELCDVLWWVLRWVCGKPGIVSEEELLHASDSNRLRIVFMVLYDLGSTICIDLSWKALK